MLRYYLGCSGTNYEKKMCIAAGGGVEETSANIPNSPTVDEGGQMVMSLSTPTPVAGEGGGERSGMPGLLKLPLYGWGNE